MGSSNPYMWKLFNYRGPGSGKTSIAIHRTDLIKQDNPSSSVKLFYLRIL